MVIQKIKSVKNVNVNTDSRYETQTVGKQREDHPTVYTAADKTLHDSQESADAQTESIQNDRATLLEVGTYEKRIKINKR